MNEDEMGLIEVSASKSGGCWGRHLKDWGLACSTMCCESKGWWVRRCLRIPRKSTAAPSPDQSLCCRGWRDHGSYVDPYRSQGCWPVFFFSEWPFGCSVLDNMILWDFHYDGDWENTRDRRGPVLSRPGRKPSSPEEARGKHICISKVYRPPTRLSMKHVSYSPL